MGKSLLFLTLIFSLSLTTVSGRHSSTISGFVRDSITGEDLINTVVRIRELSGSGTSCNAYGFFSITVPDGSYTISFQLMGYNPKSVTIDLKQNTKLNISLSMSASQLAEVSVTAGKKNGKITKTQMGIEKIEMKEIEKIPVIFGEKDVLKTLQLMPGVKSAGEGNSGFYVRGGNADQNLILLDEATVYNASHLLGFFSVFNSDALIDITFYKGTQPAEYGGRLSSVLDGKFR